MASITFGTDGVRGRAYDDVSLADAFLIGQASARALGATRAVIGRDTRESGPDLTAAVAAGLRAGGVAPMDLGVAPTPAVAHVARHHDAIGVVVSASHNPWHDNGIKLFSRLGSKLSDADQAGVEASLAELETDSKTGQYPALAQPLPSIQHDVGIWTKAIGTSIDHDLAGVKVVIDCANGAASHVAAPVLVDLGADVTVLFNHPDGRNINAACGSTHPGALAAAVKDLGANVGLALDGDADRLLAVDSDGCVVDGDQLMAMLAIDMNDRGVLAGSHLVVTVMSNLGLLRAMERAGINVTVTPVGDRHVLMGIDRLGANFGGEQSGHLIFQDFGGTGDGLLSGIQVMSLLKRSGASLAEHAAQAMTVFPQVLQNVAVSDKIPDIADRMQQDIAASESRLGDSGRVLVRPSGTEPVIRVMVEAAQVSHAQRECDALCAVVRNLG